MADTASGGWVRRAAMSCVSTRPSASRSAIVSAGKGCAPASTRSRASATDIAATVSILCFEMTGFAATLFQEPDTLDVHPAFDRFDHVVDGQARNRHRGQRLH